MEIWKPIKGFEDIYSVSNLGRVMRTGKGGGGAAIVGKILSNARDVQGYERINLCKNSYGAPKKIHRLVAEAFIGELPYGLTVNHIDGIKHNNNASNLEIISRGANISHSFKVIKTQSVVGELNPRAVLTEEKVLDIRKRLKKGCRPSDLVAEFGVTKHTISNIKVRKTWAHI